ncbi:alpha/beta fold hydrolase [Streptomyces sp. CA-132043]|uniref:alpha/beta fold hydrolase n=1 Tax=Streptomyces sp. CA-132043 TaxID=3240048 RepID=UPI003D8FD7DD
MRRERPMVTTVWDEATLGAPRVVMVYGSLAPGTEVFAGQRTLAELFRLELVGPAAGGTGAERSGVAELLDRGAHLVGHCTGATVALHVAAAAPQAVRSLTLLEPCALRATAGRLAAYGEPATGAPGLRPAALLTADWPKLIVNGAPGRPYDAHRGCPHPTPPGYGEQVADVIGARHLRVEDAGHAPQRDRPGRVNTALRRLWQG